LNWPPESARVKYPTLSGSGTGLDERALQDRLLESI